MSEEPDNLIASSDVKQEFPWWKLEKDDTSFLTRVGFVASDVIGLMSSFYCVMTNNGMGIALSLTMTLLVIWVINANDPSYD